MIFYTILLSKEKFKILIAGKNGGTIISIRAKSLETRIKSFRPQKSYQN